MKKFKNIGLALFSSLLFVLSSFIFAGCKDDRDIVDVYVFATEGGYVQVDEMVFVRFGDGGRHFNYNEDDSIKLEAVAEPGYKFSNWAYSNNLSEEFIDLSILTEITLPLDEDIIVVQAVFEKNAPSAFEVSYDAGRRYNIIPESGYDFTVLPGGEFKFKMTIDEAYNESVPQVVVDGEIIHADNGVYTISDINTNIEIIVNNVVKNTYAVTWQTSEAYTINVLNGVDADEVEFGADFEFEIELASKYNKSDIEVWARGVKLDSHNGVYSVENIIGDFSILIENITENTYIIELPTVPGVSIEPVQNYATEVAHNGSFQFTITPKNAQVDITNIVVKSNGNTIVKVDGQDYYEINNIQEDIEITVIGVSVVTHSVSTTDERITITVVDGYAGSQVVHGENCTFTIGFNKGYQAGAGFAVYVNAEPISLTDGKYVIEYVVADQVVTVTGVEKCTYTVILPTNAGYTITPEEGYTTSVKYLDEFKFRVSVNDGFCQPSAVKANGDEIRKTGEIYTTTVTDNTEITVEGVEQVEQFVPVTFKAHSDYYTINLLAGTLNADNILNVTSGTQVKFTVAPKMTAQEYDYTDIAVVISTSGTTHTELEAVNGEYSFVATGTTIVTIDGCVIKHKAVLDYGDSDLNVLVANNVDNAPKEIMIYAPVELSTYAGHDTKNVKAVVNENTTTTLLDLINTLNDAVNEVGYNWRVTGFSVNDQTCISIEYEESTPNISFDVSKYAGGTWTIIWEIIKVEA